MAYEINFTVTDAIKKIFRFDDIRKLNDFAKEEAKFWNEKKQTLSALGRRSDHMDYTNIWSAISSTIDSYSKDIETWDKNTLNTNFNRNVPNWAQTLNQRWTWCGHPFIDLWVDSYRLSNDAGNAFYEAMRGNALDNRNYEAFRGYLLGIEYQLKNIPEFKLHADGYENSFERLRESLIKKKDELFNLITERNTEINEWLEATKSTVGKWHTDADRAFIGWFSELKTNSNQYETSRNDTFNSELDTWKKQIVELENSLREKLRFEGPATYWKARAEKLNAQGMYWAGALVLSLCVGIGCFLYAFTTWLRGETLPLNLHSFQGAIIFASMLSAYAFLIKTFSRLAFSSFHLQRDAEEREQLTHLYLALSKDATVDATSRNIVLQALFSRSESGLLTKESAPAMPTVSEVLKTTSAISK